MLFANDVVLLALSGGGFQFGLEWFAAVGMRISTSKSGATVHSWRRMECSLNRDQLLLFVYTGVLFMYEKGSERWTDGSGWRLHGCGHCVPLGRGESRAEHRCEAVDLLLDLRPSWLRALGSDRRMR